MTTSRLAPKGVTRDRDFLHAGRLEPATSACYRRPMTSSPDALRADEGALVALMIAYQAGDLAAFEQLYAALVEDVRRYFARTHRDHGAAGDLVQDLFLELHRARRTYAPPRPVRPWVFGIARNVAARSRRAARARQAHAPVDAERDAVAASAPPATALDIQTALAALPAGARDAWILHHVQGFSFHSIAARLGVTVMAAKLRSSRAMRILRAVLSGAPESPDHG
jgi:RNA polymerase sigma-70 factor (ECF subfamily)